MRKRYWVLLAIMMFGGAGDLIGGTDTPGRATVDPAVSPAVVRVDVPAAPRFDATMVVSASSLNLLMAPSMVGAALPFSP